MGNPIYLGHMDNQRIRCNIIDYRKGYIEVTPGIHSGCVNIEAWNTDPNLGIENLDVGDLPEGAVIGNTELELSLEMARALVHALNIAIKSAESVE